MNMYQLIKAAGGGRMLGWDCYCFCVSDSGIGFLCVNNSPIAISILKKRRANDLSYTLTLFDFGWGLSKTEGGETNREEDQKVRSEEEQSE